MKNRPVTDKVCNILLMIAVLFFFVSNFFLIDTDIKHNTLFAYIASIVLVFGITVSVYLIVEHYFLFPSHSMLLPILTLFLLSLFPELLYQYKTNMVSLLLVWVLYFSLRFTIGERGFGALFISFGLLAIVAFIVPQLIWLIPVFFFLLLYYADFNPRVPVVMLGGFLTPVIYLTAYGFIEEEKMSIGVLRDFFTPAFQITASFPFSVFSMEILMLSVILAAFLIAGGYVIAKNRKQRVKVTLALNMTLFTAVALLVIIFLFYMGNPKLSFVLAAPYISILLFNLFKSSMSKKMTRVVCYLLIILTILIRIADIVTIDKIMMGLPSFR